MVDAIKQGALGAYIPFDRQGRPVRLYFYRDETARILRAKTENRPANE